MKTKKLKLVLAACGVFALPLALASAVYAAEPAPGSVAKKPTPAKVEKADKAAKPDVGDKADKAFDNPLKLADDAPTMYTVTKGDTLWDISAKFLKEPWRWPEIWNMNRDQVKDPHWIYPGDVIQLSFDASGRPMLSIGGKGGSSTTSGGTLSVSPSIRSQALSAAIPSIAARAINPFLSLPLVVEAGALANSPKIVATEDERVIIGTGNKAYVVGLTESQGLKWHVYRPGKTLRDPVTNEVLGHEVVYLGDARVTRYGDANTSSSIEIIKASREINRGDRLMPAGDISLPNYVPRAPSSRVTGRTVSVLDGVTESGQYSAIVVNLGKRDGMEVGHVLASNQMGGVVSTQTESTGAADGSSGSGLRSWLPGKWAGSSDGLPATVNVPGERTGLLFVFRVFDRVSYALVMSTKRPLRVGDTVTTP